MNVPSPVVAATCCAVLDGEAERGARVLAEETAVALTLDAHTHAVMMATPQDLEDFAIGFARAEGVIDRLDDVAGLEIVPTEDGVEARMWLKPARGGAYRARRRALAGPVGCGLCGVDSLEEAVRPPDAVSGALSLAPEDVENAVRAMAAHQRLHAATRAMHAAAFWTPGEGLVALREDVGRHNALDKLAGALHRAGRSGAGGAVVLTSRVSVELVQKTARLGAPILIAVSAPTALAVRAAQGCGLTLIASARGARFDVHAHLQRLGAARLASVGPAPLPPADDAATRIGAVLA